MKKATLKGKSHTLIRKSSKNIAQKSIDNDKSYSLDKIRETHKGAYTPWTAEQDEELTVNVLRRCEYKRYFPNISGRTKGAIYSRIKKLELADIYG